jgi:tetratricopeptide (TPR) repeat protein
MGRYFDAMQAELRRHGGTIEKFIGDAVMAVFGLPKLHEDDALRAVRAARGMQDALARLNEELRRRYGVELTNRTGVNTGEVVAGDATTGQRLVTGDAVNVAARLEQAAGPNEVLIGDLTHTLVRDQVEVEPVEPLELKGKSERVPAWRLLGVRHRMASAPGHPTPLVGRERELAVLTEAFDAAAGSRACRIVTVVGDPGVGKSRLIDEVIAARGDDATVMRGRCLPYGDGITFWPVAEAMRAAAGVDVDDPADEVERKIDELASGTGADRAAIVARMASILGLGTPVFPVDEVFWATRKLLESLARRGPVLFVVDDVHDAEPTFLRLLDHLVESTSDAPILIVATARHELLTEHEGWADAPGRVLLPLEPLGEAGSDALIGRLLGSDVPAAVAERIRLAAEGNPLFFEQLAEMLVERAGEVALEEAVVPPSIQALLAARLDLLSREERGVVEPASVAGVFFEQDAVEALVADVLRPSVGAQLASLDRKQFVHPRADDAEATFRFHHQLVRDTAYQSLLKRTRATLHERFVEWGQAVNRERSRSVEFEEINGYHLEQAYRYRGELGPIDVEGRAIGDRASALLESAGRRAFGRNDMHAAANLLARARDVLDPADPRRGDIAPELAEALMEEGEFEAARVVLREAADAARGNPSQLARLTCVRVGLVLYTGEADPAAPDGEALATDAERVGAVQAAIELFERSSDFAGLARAYRVLMILHGTSGRYVEATEAADRCVHAATLAGDTRLAARGASGYATGALHGPTPVGEVIGRCEELVAETTDRKTEGTVSLALAVLCAMQGEFDRARALASRGSASLADLGRSVTAASTSIEASLVEMLAGDLAAAERLLRRDDAALEAMGERYFRSTIVGLLALVILLRGDPTAALEQTLVCEMLADEDDVWSQALWRSVRARVIAGRGEIEEALALVSGAVGMADGSADLDLRAGMRVDQGEVLLVAGRTAEAASAFHAAVELYEEKGNTVMAARVAERVTVTSQAATA